MNALSILPAALTQRAFLLVESFNVTPVREGVLHQVQEEPTRAQGKFAFVSRAPSENRAQDAKLSLNSLSSRETAALRKFTALNEQLDKELDVENSFKGKIHVTIAI